MRWLVMAGLVLLAGCTPPEFTQANYGFKPVAQMDEAEQRSAHDCSAQAVAAGGAAASAQTGLFFAERERARSERQVYEFCMRGKGYNPLAR